MNDFTVSIVSWADKRDELLMVRRVVFIEEQGVPESIEIDGRDADCRHVLAIDTEGRPIGSARLDATGKIGRMAVLVDCRGRGVGTAMLNAIMDHGRASGITDFHLSAQITAVDFYKKMGFQTTGTKFLEAGIEHVNMKKV